MSEPVAERETADPHEVVRLELVVAGMPASLQASPTARDRWKKRVREAARAVIREEDKLDKECRGIVVFFYLVETDLDVDNIVKPVSDALCGIAFFDDRIVSEWIARKTDLAKTEILDPPPGVADLLAREQPFVYICIVGQAPKHAELPQ